MSRRPSARPITAGPLLRSPSRLSQSGDQAPWLNCLVYIAKSGPTANTSSSPGKPSWAELVATAAGTVMKVPPRSSQSEFQSGDGTQWNSDWEDLGGTF